MGMINLIPPKTRSDILYARRNKALRGWIFALLIGMAGVLLVVIVGLIQIDQKAAQLDKEIAIAHESLKEQKLEETNSQVQDMSNNFKLVTQVLSKQVLFSEVLKQVGSTMPDGAALSTLSIEELSGGIDLQVAAKDFQTATQVQVNLADSENKLFSKVDIINITCGGADSTYPCSGSYRALYADKNPFFFLNSNTGGATQ